MSNIYAWLLLALFHLDIIFHSLSVFEILSLIADPSDLADRSSRFRFISFHFAPLLRRKTQLNYDEFLWIRTWWCSMPLPALDPPLLLFLSPSLSFSLPTTVRYARTWDTPFQWFPNLFVGWERNNSKVNLRRTKLS